MEVKIEFIKNMNSVIEFAKQVKDISKDLIETCKMNGVVELTYIHDYFKIYIKQPQDIIQQNIVPLLEETLEKFEEHNTTEEDCPNSVCVLY